MKFITSILAILILSLNAFSGEDIFSFYFHKKSLFSLHSVNAVHPQLFGKYEPKDTPKNEMRRAAGETIVLDATGIYLEKNKLLFISKEEVRENSKYTVRNGWMHGVVENDSLPCALDEEKYYFLVPAKTYLYESGRAPNRMMQITKTSYALFTFEDNGHYSAMVVSIVGNHVFLKDVVFSKTGANDMNKIQEKEELETEQDDFKTFILSPSLEEWEDFIFKSCLEEYDTYTKVTE